MFIFVRPFLESEFSEFKEFSELRIENYIPPLKFS